MSKPEPKIPKKPTWRIKGLYLTHVWTDEQIALLGTMTDAEVAKQLGISTIEVTAERKSRRIRVVRPKPFEWKDEHIALLGTMIDRDVAAKIGTSKQIVLKKRMDLGILPVKPMPKRIKWTPALVAALGKLSDAEVAKQIGTTSVNVAKKRAGLGIPAYADSLNQGRRILQRVKHICDQRSGKLLANESDYKNKDSKVLVQCDKGHLFKITPNSLFKGNWCASCGRDGVRKYNVTHLHQFAESKGGKCHSTRYTNDKVLYDWECKEGHRWQYNWHNMRKLANWCPSCRTIAEAERKAKIKRRQVRRMTHSEELRTGNT